MEIAETKTDLKAKLVAAFALFEQARNGEGSQDDKQMRRAAIESFAQLGFPTPRLERWKYTNLAPVLRHDYVPQILAPESMPAAADINAQLLPEVRANVLVFVNGWFAEEHSRVVSAAGALEIGSLARARRNGGEVLHRYFGRAADYTQDAMTALNTAFAQDGAYVYIPDNCRLPELIHIINITDARGEARLAQPRNLVVLGANAQAAILLSGVTLGANQALINEMSEIVLEPGAHLELTRVRNDAANTCQVKTSCVHQRDNSTFTSVEVSLGGGLARNNINAVLDGSGCTANLYGLSLLKDREIVDNFTVVDHARPHSQSNELYKGVYDERSTGSFSGKIIVRPDAQKTNAFQSNKSILLSDSATVNSRPQLEIFADDVKCSHGATSGRLDEDAMFYLRSRGIGRDAARAIMVRAFAAEILEQLSIDELRNLLERNINQRLSLEH